MSYFGEIRSAAQARPSELAWSRLFDAIAQVRISHFAEEMLPYLDRNLESWPDALRVCPQGLLDMLLDHDLEHPGLILVRRLWRAHASLEDVETIVSTRCLSSVTSLSLVTNGLPAEVVSVVLDGAQMNRIEALDLSYNRIGDEGAASIAAHPRSAVLKHLSLDNNGITDAGAEALAMSPLLGGLESLSLFGNPIGIWGMEALRSSEYLSEGVRRQWFFSQEL